MFLTLFKLAIFAVMSNNECVICTNSVTKKLPGIQCQGFCRKFYHIKCVDMSKEAMNLLNSITGSAWICNSCRVNDNVTASSSPSVVDPLNSLTQSKLDAGEASLAAFMQQVTRELRDIKKQQVELLASVNFCSNKVTDFEAMMSEFKASQKTVEMLKKQNETLVCQVATLNKKVHDFEQHSRLKNVEIQGVPEKAGEDIFCVVKKIYDFMDLIYDQQLIESAYRVRSYNASSSKAERNIIVSFTSKKSRDALLSAARTKRLGGSDKQPGFKVDSVSNKLFLNEHLTPDNKILFRNARGAAKDKNYKYCWIKNAVIFVRKDDRAKVRRISTLDDISKM